MSIALLVAIVAVLAVLTLAAPIHYLLAFDLLLVALPPGEWQLGGIMFDPSDLAYGSLALALALRGRPRGPQRVPYLGLWIALGVLFSLSYMAAPVNSANMTDPARIVYQLYRYAWKPLLMYPLAALFLTTARPTRATIYVVVAAGVLCALQAIPQGYSGMRADGPMQTANALGSALVVPILFAFVLMIATPGSPRRRALLAAALLVLVRGLLFSGSRGAMAATAFSLTLSTFLLFRLPGTRRSAIRFVVPIAALCVFVLVLPGTLDRPNIQRMLSLAEGQSADTFQWRTQERWGYFLEKALDQPFLGTGEAVDLSLGGAGNTPHNGYIAVAVKAGFPALAIYIVFALLAVRNALRLVRERRPNPWGPIVGVLCLSAIGALLVHNIVESNLEIGFPAKLFWVYVALANVAGQALARARTPAPHLVRTRRHRQLGAATPVGNR